MIAAWVRHRAACCISRRGSKKDWRKRKSPIRHELRVRIPQTTCYSGGGKPGDLIHSSIAAERSVSSALRNKRSRAGPSGQASAFRRASFAIASSLLRSDPGGLMRLRGKMVDLSPDQLGLHGEPRFSSNAGGSENFSWLARTARPTVALLDFQGVADD
jgi:hypothetical protein